MHFKVLKYNKVDVMHTLNSSGGLADDIITGNGYGNGTIIRLYDNKLTRLDATVFQSMLEKMAPFGGWPNAHINVEYSKI